MIETMTSSSVVRTSAVSRSGCTSIGVCRNAFTSVVLGKIDDYERVGADAARASKVSPKAGIPRSALKPWRYRYSY